MGIPNDSCAGCCDTALNCPSPLPKYKGRSAINCAFDPGGLGQYYQTETKTYDFAWSDSGSAGTALNGCPGPITSYVHSASGTATVTCTTTSGNLVCGPLTGSASVSLVSNAYGGDCGPSDCGFAVVTSSSQSWPFGSTGSETIDITFKSCTGGTNSSVTTPFNADFDDYGHPYSTSVSYSDLVSSGQLKENALNELGPYPSDWSFTPDYASYEETEGAAHCVSVSDSIYQIAFKIPAQVRCYRASWVERFIAKNGVGITSIEIVSAGVYRPTVTASGVGGCVLVASMSSSGAVTAINILNPGQGYLVAPTITVQSAINGGTTSTGWAATISNGAVVSVTGGSGGNYLPTGSFSGGSGGSGATASVALDRQGGLDSIYVGSSGSGYLGEPRVSIEPKVSGSKAATFLIHMGNETQLCSNWNKAIPSGYDPEDSDTWPTLPAGGGYFILDVPTSEGTTSLANVRATCDCSTC
jgi:hypothetical protein